MGSLVVLNDNDFGLAEGDISLDGNVLLTPDPTPTTLGFIGFGEGNTLDPSDEDSGINLQNHPVFGLYQPDASASFDTNGQTYYITANEGDARDEDERIQDLTLDPEAFPDAATLQEDQNLGRLTVSTIDGDLDGDGDFDQLFTYGGRSFSIWDAVGNQVFDSGEQIARITAEQTPDFFNANDGDPGEFDQRSDDKGAEPEAVTVGKVGNRTYAFIGLERSGGGVLVYDVSTPNSPEFLQYIRSDEDIAPEGLTFVSAADSPQGQPLLVVTNEESSTAAVYEFTAPLKIYDIQGEGHFSPVVGQTISTTGIVTTVAANGFYLQDPEGDGNDNTSDSIFVSAGGASDFAVGDQLALTGEVAEFIPGGADTGNLSITQLTNITDVTVLSSGNDGSEAVVMDAFSAKVIDDAVPPVLNEMMGPSGRDSLQGETNDDRIMGLTGRDLILGRGANDLIAGNQEQDRLFGGAGADTLLGGGGHDLLVGGGADGFVLDIDPGIDTITNFNVDQDIIGLTAGLTLGQLSVNSEGGDTLLSLVPKTF